ncbi:head maturation protease, ClpP-related [Alsobacter sp. R-9]
MSVIIQDGEIHLSGMVGGVASGDSFWDPPGFASSDIVQALAEVGRDRPVTIRLNSGGGIATEGAAIHAALSQHRGAVHVIVEGIAASAASLIAAAGDTVSIAPGAVMMIHDVATMTYGTVADHELTIKALDAMGDAYAAVYAERTGKSVEEMRDMMRAETWLTADEAVDLGLADAIYDAKPSTDEPAPFAYAMYARAPQRLVALASAKGWRPRALQLAASAASTPDKESTMADAPKKDEPTMEDPTKTEDPAMETDEEVTAETEEEVTASEDEEVVASEDEEVTAETVEVEVTEDDEEEDVPAVAALCASFGMNAGQIRKFLAKGGTMKAAKARAAEIDKIRDAIARATRTKGPVKLTAAEAVAKDMTIEQARAALFDEITPAPAVDPQAPLPNAKSKSVMADAVADMSRRMNALKPRKG